MGQNEDLEEKKLLGSGGYAFAKLTEQEEEVTREMPAGATAVITTNEVF